ncbi:MAG TPA: copper homeostasis protein CutC [Salinivirgaceae bacterium]|nr:copper homeostasis protein CutC [Salinivirgaceae bacterium]HQA75991.1 copper homeostasis protein CutC [Salinivirgaceae bacterium]
MSQNRTLLEVAVFTPESAIVACQAGADRIELCSGYSEGGLSPSAASIKLVRQSVDCKLHVMIRPRIGDFLYSEFEKEIILEDIKFCKITDVDGIVVGALTQSGDIDTDFVKTVVETAYPMQVTFHRAFDISRDLFSSLDELINCGVNRILTSGGKSSAFEGLQTLSELVKRAANKITILPGGGISPKNVLEILNTTKAREVHFSGKQLVKSKMEPLSRVKLSSTTDTDDYNWYECDFEVVRKMIYILN